MADGGAAVVPDRGTRSARALHEHRGPGSARWATAAPASTRASRASASGITSGYGYGGDALGVGADGGYPFYGGPGYPHPWPRLRRFGGITPFPYYGGPGCPTPDLSQLLRGRRPARRRPAGHRDRAPNPARPTTPAATAPSPGSSPIPSRSSPRSRPAAGTGASTSGVSSGLPLPPSIHPAAAAGRPAAPAPPAASTSPLPRRPRRGPLPRDRRRAGRRRERRARAEGLQGLCRERGGKGRPPCRRRDPLDQRLPHTEGGNLAWIIANAAPDRVLKMSVQAASDGELRTITARLP